MKYTSALCPFSIYFLIASISFLSALNEERAYEAVLLHCVQPLCLVKLSELFRRMLVLLIVGQAGLGQF